MNKENIEKITNLLEELTNEAAKFASNKEKKELFKELDKIKRLSKEIQELDEEDHDEIDYYKECDDIDKEDLKERVNEFIEENDTFIFLSEGKGVIHSNKIDIMTEISCFINNLYKNDEIDKKDIKTLKDVFDVIIKVNK